MTEQDTLQEIAKAGERIYDQKYKAQYESKFPDHYAVIDIDTEEAVVGEYAEDAVVNATRRFGTHRQHLIRIGSTSAVQLGSFFPDASLAWAV